MLGGRKEIDPWSGAVINDPGVDGDFMNLNLARMLGETGAALGGEGSWQEAVGLGASNMARNKAYQEAVAKQLQEKDTLQNMLLKAAADGTLLNSKDKNNLFDEVKVSGDGDVSLTMKNTPAEIGFDDEDLGLESKAPLGGSDLRDFLQHSWDNWA